MTPRALLKVLQLGDSFFPSGANVFSHGAEGLREADRLRTPQDVEQFVEGQLAHRWLTADRVAVAHAHAASDLTRVSQIDRFVDRSTLVSSWRLGGRRAGRALLRVHSELSTPRCAEYAALPEAPAQVSVVQGLIASAVGLDTTEAMALSGYGLALSLVSATLRLGVIGHLDAQRILGAAVERIATAIVEPVPSLDAYASWLPDAEIASMRQEARRGRLFAS